MKKETRQPFTPTGEYHARRGFRFHGRDYAPGDEFPWRHLSCSTRKLKLLYEGRFIDPGPALEKGAAPEPAPPVEEPKTPAPEDTGTTEGEGSETEEVEDPGTGEEQEEQEEEEETPPQAFKFVPGQHQVKSAGSGKFKVVTKSGKFRLYVTPKEAQRLKKAKRPTEVRPEEVIE